MDTQKDHYAILGVLDTAEDIVIAGAYRALAQRYHPDRFQGDKDEANARMAEINEAFRILSNAELRAKYDEARLHGPGSESGSTGGDMPFEMETFRPFAEKLREFGYAEDAIRKALLIRGARPPVAERLARAVAAK